MIAATVIILGRTRSRPLRGSPPRSPRLTESRGPRPLFVRLVEVDEHDNARLGGDARQGDEPGTDRHGQVVPSRFTPYPPTSANGKESMTMSVSVTFRKLR